MRLLTHNMLSSNIKGVINGFPLRIEVEKVVEKQVDFNPDFLKNMFSKIDWKALADASKIMGYAELPEEVPDASVLDSDEFLQKFHHALLELHLEEGALVCPETGRRFPVNKGIPNMLLHEDELQLYFKITNNPPQSATTNITSAPIAPPPPLTASQGGVIIRPPPPPMRDGPRPMPLGGNLPAPPRPLVGGGMPNFIPRPIMSPPPQGFKGKQCTKFTAITGSI